MGITALRKHLPTKKVQDYTQLKRGVVPMRIDVASAIWRCASWNMLSYIDGDYTLAWAHWQRLVLQWKMMKVDATLAFDGKDSAHKNPERERRDEKAAAARALIDAKATNGGTVLTDEDVPKEIIRNQPLYIAGCIKIASAAGFKCIVLPTEADAYAAGVDCSGSVVSVSGDGDMAFWSQFWVCPRDWHTGSATVVDFGSFTEGDERDYPLVAAYKKHGKKAIIYGTAVAGCDIVTRGLSHGLGWSKVIEAMNAVEEANPESLVSFLKEHYGSVATGDEDQYWQGVVGAMEAVEAGVEDGQFYGDGGVIKTADGTTKTGACADAAAHMRGTRNSRTGTAFSAEEQSILDGLDTSNLTLPSQVPASQIDAAAELGNNPSADDARQFVVALGGSTRQDGKALTNSQSVALARKYQAMAAEVPFERANRTKTGGVFGELKVTGATKNRTVIKTLLAEKEIDKAKHMNLRKFLEDVDSEYTRGSFVSDHDDIIRTGPEMSDQLLPHFYAPLGSQSEAGKAIAQSTKRAVAPNELMEHSIARAASGECVYLSSKIRASMKTDPSAKSEDHGEKKDKKPHMTLVELLLQETTAEEDDHELGRAWIVGRTWCTCYNGASLCGHKGTVVQIQRLHWDEDRPEPKPTHFAAKGWGKHGRKRSASVLLPLHAMAVGDPSSGATQFRQCRESSAKADYAVADKAVMEAWLNPARMTKFCRLLQRNNVAKAKGGGDSSGSGSESGE